MGLIITLIIIWVFFLRIDYLYNDENIKTPYLTSLIILFTIWSGIMLIKHDQSFKHEYHSKYKKLQLIENDILKIQNNNYIFKWDGNYHEINDEDINIKLNDDSTYIELLYINKITYKEKNFFYIKDVQDTSYSKNPKYILHKKL